MDPAVKASSSVKLDCGRLIFFSFLPLCVLVSSSQLGYRRGHLGTFGLKKMKKVKGCLLERVSHFREILTLSGEVRENKKHSNQHFWAFGPRGNPIWTEVEVVTGRGQAEVEERAGRTSTYWYRYSLVLLKYSYLTALYFFGLFLALFQSPYMSWCIL